MNRYIDAEKLKYEIERRNLSNYHTTTEGYEEELYEIIDSLQQEQTDMGEVSDGYHTFNELYYYRMLYNAAFFNLLPKWWVHKSKRHHTGEECFGGGWFIVMANLPTGQISNHYELKDWDLFQVPEKEIADEWDGHTPQEAAERIHKYLQQEQPEPTCKTCGFYENNCPFIRGKLIPYPNKVCKDYTYSVVKAQEQSEPFSCGHENGYDEAYLQEKIAKASKTWEGVDADKYLDEVRGREQVQPQVADASKMEPEVELEKASRNVYESWKGGTMDNFLQDMVELGKALNARKEGQK